jgi:uncharacterized SAM-binding protein YcdF (DUF218 family)
VIWPQALRALGAIVILFFLATSFTPLPNLLSRRLILAPPLEPVDAIVVLGSGGVWTNGDLSDSSLRHTLRGIDLYRKGLAPFLVFSGSRLPSGLTEAGARAEFARECGISSTAILTAPSSHTTREEASTIAALLQPRGLRKILLVVDAEGTRRATAVFEKAGFTALPVPAVDVARSGGSPEDRFELVRRVLMEAVALVYYRVAGYL